MAKIVGLNEKMSDDQKVVLPTFDTYYEMFVRVCDRKDKQAVCPNWRQNINSLHSQMINDRSAFEDKIKAIMTIRVEDPYR